MKTSLILGFFDGVHAGHKAVIESALKYGEKSILITFKQSPALYFGNCAEYILSRKESLNKIKHLGVGDIVELDFFEIADMTAQEYLEFLVNRFSPVSISTGFNHTFGVNKTGNSEFLEKNQKKYGYKYFCILPVKDSGEIVSSTNIKKLLKEGKVEKANKLLQSNFILEGKVVHGQKIGATIGFPTANIKYPQNIVMLPFGVYCSIVSFDGYSYRGITNWGMKPTLNNTVEPVVETHLLNYSGDLYEKEVKVEILKYIRGEVKFNSLNELKNQIEKDVKSCLE